MLTELFYQWNPFNLCGTEVKVDDLICNPLRSTETLRQDCYGRCKRIQTPSVHSSFWERFVFWLQTYLNEKGHLEAIDKMISLFQEKLLENPPKVIEKLQEFNLQADQLFALKNDYGFTYLKQGNSAFIESRLDEIKRQAYLIFSQYHEQQVLSEEEARKKAFILFQEEIEQKLRELDSDYLSGLYQSCFLLIAFSDRLQCLFEERIVSLQSRFKMIQELQQKIDEMEALLQGKFTISCIKDYFQCLRVKLCNEVRKIGVETENVLGNLLINYRITPFKEEVKVLLYSVEIDPDEMPISQISMFPCRDELNGEIARIQGIFKFIFKVSQSNG
jgi:hypothetical protein